MADTRDWPETPILERVQHVYLCECGASWSQVDGSDPQTHRPGCRHAKPGDVQSVRAAGEGDTAT